MLQHRGILRGNLVITLQQCTVGIKNKKFPSYDAVASLPERHCKRRKAGRGLGTRLMMQWTPYSPIKMKRPYHLWSLVCPYQKGFQCNMFGEDLKPFICSHTITVITHQTLISPHLLQLGTHRIEYHIREKTVPLKY